MVKSCRIVWAEFRFSPINLWTIGCLRKDKSFEKAKTIGVNARSRSKSQNKRLCKLKEIIDERNKN